MKQDSFLVKYGSFKPYFNFKKWDFKLFLRIFKFLDFHHKIFLKDKTPPQAKPHRLQTQESANA